MHPRRHPGCRAQFDIYPAFQSIARALPEGAGVLLHDNHNHLGIGAETLSDWNGWQHGISYGRQRAPSEVWDLLKGIGLTHVAWDTQVSMGWDTVAGDLMFFDFALKRTVKRAKYGGMTLAEMGPPPGPASPVPHHRGLPWAAAMPTNQGSTSSAT